VNLDHVSHRLFQFAFVALAMFVPFSIAGANIAIGFGLMAWLLAAIATRRGGTSYSRESGRPKIRRDPMLIAATLLAVSALPSVFMSENLTRAVHDWRSYWLLSIYFLVAANLAAHGMREAAYWTLFASTTISCLVAFVQRAGGIDFWFIHLSGKHRVESTLFTMTFAGILYQAIVLNLAVALRKHREWRHSLVLWVGLAVQLVAIVLTVTRGAWVALFAGLATVCILVRNRTVVALSAAALAAVLIFAFVTARDTGRNVSPLLLFQEVDIHAGTRLVLWDIAWDLFRAHPILGVGMGDYSVEADKLVGDRTVTTTTDTHNVYLQILATRGLVGFLPFVFFWWVVFRSLFQIKARAAKGSIEWHYAVGVIGVTVAILFGALTENNVDDEEVFIAYMFILGLARSVEYASRASGRNSNAGAESGDRSGLS
jgi:O-antigen ligase